MGTILIICAVPIGVEAVAVSMLISNFLSAVINAYPNKKLLGYSYKMQILDVLPSFVMSALMYITVSLILAFSFSSLMLLLLQVIVGVVVYLLLAIIMKNDSLLLIIHFLKKGIKKSV